MKSKYPKVINFGEEITEFFKDGTLHIEEKIDGSQFRIFVDKGIVQCGSKNIDFSAEKLPDNMFNPAVENANMLFRGSKLADTMIFAEYLKKPKQNTMCYERIPTQNFIVFDVRIGDKFLNYEDKVKFAKQFGLEVVPKIWQGNGKKLTMEIIDKLLENESILGKEKIEGMVFKNYSKMFTDGYQAGKLIILKYVREDFKERNAKEWRGNTKKGFLELLVEEYRNDARWKKAIQHLKEEGKLTNSPKDIGILLKEINVDFEQEEAENITKRLWEFFRKDIIRGITKGFPEWYKREILKDAIEGEK